MPQYTGFGATAANQPLSKLTCTRRKEHRRRRGGHPIQSINEAYERMLKSDVKYRFSIDMASPPV